ncbi:hypothetical protein FQR65_LT08817 [Abscondita terminalis]|nr:hypothetical protein FQR65_LT08817 [Abscondita terminalis]
MRENPNKAKDNLYSGENFVRFTGDTQKHAKAQLFAWEAYEKGVDVHLLAEPTKLELLQQEYDKKKDQFKSQVQKDVLERYGGEEHLQVPPKSLLMSQTEDYVEYSRSGKVIKGQEKQIVKSKYEEDVYINNHTSVWGSFWKGGQWGYKCCHSFIKNSYCLGEAGRLKEAINIPVIKNEKEKVHESSEDSSTSSSSDNEQTEKTKRKSEKKKKKKMKRKEKKRKIKEEKKDGLTEALKAEEQSQKQADHLLEIDERKRPYNSMYDVKKPTDDEMEAYFIKRRRDEDPMNQFI